VSPGDVLLITGPSGSGKTSLLNVLAGKAAPTDGLLTRPDGLRVGTFEPINSVKAMVEVIGTGDVQDSLSLMGTVGLSDAHIYLKRFSELSNGQQYRAMLARLLTSRSNVWLADEFCSNLDILTANGVADRLQALARRLQAILIVASSNPDGFARALRPSAVVQLTTAWEHQVLSGKEYLARLPAQNSRFDAPKLNVSPACFRQVERGEVRAILHPGNVSLTRGPLYLKAGGCTRLVMVSDSRVTSKANLVGMGVPAFSEQPISDSVARKRFILTTIHRLCDE
jgi:ABC-type transport system involved in cytochrome c biogenesis ATPase subunit